ncbi:hypothetical protein [Actinokineospora globicatena]|uniref:Membrane protein involved in the export of O-antigen and teichoic acid n=1 Tax=Actinokineospora globicatena TaxID=103729 RepID=A0A9W6QIS1_9PSEU|nr:hypothetical protein [Actinokineospora globicatena]GLW89259.1 hypothetical protein Aglo03_00750 [Actinokineospora globicatena]
MRAALRVIAGRGAARAGIQLSMLALLPVWGADDFGRYVAAAGTFAWVQTLVLGVEKSALTAVPRTRLLGPQITWMLIARAATPFGLGLLATVALLPVGGLVTLYAAAAANAAGLGLMSVLVAIHRLAQRPGRDTAAFVTYAAWVIGMAGLAALGVLRPLGYLLALTGGLIVVCAVLAALVPRERPQETRPGLGGLLNRRVLLLGFSDVADTAGVSVLYIVLAVAAKPSETALVYVLILISSALGAFGVLVLRLIQPATSLRLRGTGGTGGRALARRITGWTAVVSGTVVAAVVGLASVAPVTENRVLLGFVVLVEMTTFCAVVYAVFLLENTNGAVLSLTTSAALASLITTSAVALVATGPLGAIGAFLALVVGLATKAAVLRFRLAGTQSTVEVPAVTRV